MKMHVTVDHLQFLIEIEKLWSEIPDDGDAYVEEDEDVFSTASPSPQSSFEEDDPSSDDDDGEEEDDDDGNVVSNSSTTSRDCEQLPQVSEGDRLAPLGVGVKKLLLEMYAMSNDTALKEGILSVLSEVAPDALVRELEQFVENRLAEDASLNVKDVQNVNQLLS